MPATPIALSEVWLQMIADVGGTAPSDTELRQLMLAFAQSISSSAGVSSATGGQGIYINPNTGAVVVVLDGSVSENVVASAGAAQTLPPPTLNIGNDFTLSANLVVTMPTGVIGGYCYNRVHQAASGGPYTVTYTGVKWAGGTAPTMSTGAGATDQYEFVYDNVSSVWRGVIAYQNSH